MNREQYKSRRKGQPKRNNASFKTRMAARTKDSTAAATTPKLREIYSTRTEWATKIIPKLKEK